MKQNSPPHYLTTIGFAGLQVVFTTFIGHGVTHFESLGLSQLQIATALLAGPLCGATFQLYFGIWSDQMRSSWGKRKPFIVFGTIVLIIALMSIAWGDSIARCLTTTDESYRIVLVAVILTSTFVLWIAAQAVQVGLRALVSDGCSSAEQVKSSAWAGCYSHFAAVVGNLTAYIDGSYAKQPVMRGFKSMSILASCCVACTVFVSCIAAREHTPQTSSRRIHRSTSFREIWKLLSRTSPQIRNICFVQILAWGGWFPFLFHTEKYVNSIYNEERSRMGFPSAENQNSTVGSLTLLIYTALSLCTGIILPYLSSIHKPLTMRRLWVASLGLFGLAMMGTFVVFSTTGTIVLFACVGFSWAVSAWIPYALLGAEACRIAEQRDICRSLCCDDSNTGEGNGSRDEDEILDQLGLIYGLHNLSICLPQILMCVGISLALVISGAKNSRIDGQTLDPVWILRLGGVLALIAMYVATGIREPFEESFSAEHSHCDGDGKIE